MKTGAIVAVLTTPAEPWELRQLGVFPLFLKTVPVVVLLILGAGGSGFGVGAVADKAGLSTSASIGVGAAALGAAVIAMLAGLTSFLRQNAPERPSLDLLKEHAQYVVLTEKGEIKPTKWGENLRSAYWKAAATPGPPQTKHAPLAAANDLEIWPLRRRQKKALRQARSAAAPVSLAEGTVRLVVDAYLRQMAEDESKPLVQRILG